MPVYAVTSCSTTGTAGTCWITTNCTTATAPTAITTNTVYWVMDGTGNGVGASTASATATGIPPWPTWWVREMDELAEWTAPRRVAPSRAEMERAEQVARASQVVALRQAERRQAQQLQQDVSAIERAHALLLEHLTPKQRQTFADNEWFIVEGGKSKTQYRIRGKGSLVANIDVMEREKVKHRLCGHCDPRAMPLADHLLAQKLMLEFAEDDFLRIANRHAA